MKPLMNSMKPAENMCVMQQARAIQHKIITNMFLVGKIETACFK